MNEFSHIFIANTAEAFAELLQQSDVSEKILNERIAHENNLSQRAQFWGSDNKIIITPDPIPPELLKTNMERFGYKNVINLYPAIQNVYLCVAITQDQALLEKIIEFIKTNPNIVLSSYSATKEYIQLMRIISKRTSFFSIDNMPTSENPANIVSEIDSKNGFRILVEDQFYNEDIKVPEGYICNNKNEIKISILKFIDEKKGFVVKIHNGESGWGVKIVNDTTARLIDKNRLAVWIDNLFQSDAIWKFSPYVVEEFISANKDISEGFPSGEGMINDDGYKFNYYCGQTVTNEGIFEGIFIENIPEEQTQYEELAKKALKKIGEKLYKIGYRGIFDVDFAIGENKTLYILECNARKTGGTHVFDIKNKLQLNKCFYSNDGIRYTGEIMAPQEILQKVSEIQFPIKNNPRGLFISFISKTSPLIGVVIISNNEEDAQFLTHQLIKKLNNT